MAENVGRRGESWFFRVDLPPGPDGKRRQKRLGGFATEREARRALAQSKVDIDTGKLRYGARRTLAELAAEWLEAVRPNRKASTFSNYGCLTRAYVVPRPVAVFDAVEAGGSCPGGLTGAPREKLRRTQSFVSGDRYYGRRLWTLKNPCK